MQNEMNPADYPNDADHHEDGPHSEHVIHLFDRGGEHNSSQNDKQEPDKNQKPTVIVRLIHFLWRRRKWSRMRKEGEPGPNWAEKSIVILTVGIVATASTQAYIYWKQTGIMISSLSLTERNFKLSQKQLIVADRTAKAAKDATDISAAALHADQRAWLSAVYDPRDTFSVGGDGKLRENITIQNTGKTPAMKVEGVLVLRLYRDTEVPNFKSVEPTFLEFKHPKKADPESADSVCMQVGMLIPNRPKTITVRGQTVVSAQFSNYPAHAYVSMFGSIHYEDVFGHSHWVNICTFECGNFTESFADPRAKCANYNGVDGDIE